MIHLLLILHISCTAVATTTDSSSSSSGSNNNNSILVTPELLEALCDTLDLRTVLLVTRGGEARSLLSPLFTRAKKTIRAATSADFLLDGGGDVLEESLVVDASNIDKELLEDVLALDYLGVRIPSVVVFRSGETLAGMVASGLPRLSVNQRVFFLAVEEGIISEFYSVGSAGNIRGDVWRREDGKFVFVDGVVREFAARRSNLYGARLKVLVDQQAPFLYVSSKESTATITESNGIHEIITPDRLRGMFRDVHVRFFTFL